MKIDLKIQFYVFYLIDEFQCEKVEKLKQKAIFIHITIFDDRI